MAAIDAVRSLRARMPWAVASRLFRSERLSRSQGWDRTLQRVSNGDDQYEAKEDQLAEALGEHIVCGEKIVQMFRLAPDAVAQLRQTALALQIPVNAYSASYPIILTEDQLTAQGGHPPVLTAVTEYEDGVAVVISSVRYLTTRETVVVAELADEIAAGLAGFNELIGVRHIRHQACDVLWIPADGAHIEIRADYPFGTQQSKAQLALLQARACFEGLLGAGPFANQVNIFPAIRSLYDAQGDGSMVELGFMVTGSAQKLERTRRGEQCCREEAYHLGGIGVLEAPIQPYRTSVLWRVDLGEDAMSAPEVSIRGTSSHTAEQDPFLGEMVIRNCAGILDYSHVLGRMLHHLQLPAEA